MVQPTQLYCTKGHKLAKFVLSDLIKFNLQFNLDLPEYSTGYICDVCDMDFDDLSTKLYHCIQCNYDKCLLCGSVYADITMADLTRDMIQDTSQIQIPLNLNLNHQSPQNSTNNSSTTNDHQSDYSESD